MKLAKKLETEILKVYNAYWDNYLKGNVEAMDVLLAEEYTQVGSAETEVFSNKQDAVKFLYDTIDQVSGKLEMRNRSTRLEKQDTLILIHELCDIFVLTDDKWVFYAKARASTLMQQKKEGWKIIHQHSSFPDARTGEGENIAIDKIAEENRELREAVKRRTVELVHKNRELEIEAALEKVRTVAMSMNKPDDLLNVCEVLFKEFHKLGFDEIRNAMINIHNDHKKTFLNYDYSDEIGKSITPLFYNIHPVIEKQIKQIRSANDAFSETVFKGKDLESWKEFRKSRGEKDDQRINNISALYYYFYSIGTGSIGISTFSSINEEKLELLKRFRNVFDLAYRRYNDIALAEAQAKEAQIELALERVRARTMAMQKSEELKEVIRVVYEQFVHLNILVEHAGFVMDYKVRDDYNIWIADPLGVPFEVTIPYFDSVYYNRFNEAKEKGEDFFATNLSYEEKNRFYQKLFEYVPGLSEDAKEFYFSCPGLAGSTVLLENVGLYIENFSGIPYSDEENDTLMRFGKVFQQTYTRFLDLQKAEAQAREAKIEVALERVRSRTMAMHHSDELSETAVVLFQQFTGLGISVERIFIGIMKEDSGVIDCWGTEQGGNQLSPHFEASIDEPTGFSKMYAGWKAQKKSITIHQTGKELTDYINYLRELGVPFKDDLVQENRFQGIAYFSKGLLGISTPEQQSQETISILARFAGVFDLTYTRFLDLQKAEEQARESQIQLALERVRARTMAMQHSEELAETAYVLFQQFKELDKAPKMITIGIMKEEESVIEFWVTDWSGGGAKVNRKFNASIDEPVLLNKIFTAWKEKKKSITIELAGKELQDWINYRVKLSDIPDDKDYSNSHGIVIVGFFSKGILSMSTYESVSSETSLLIERFAGVFEQTYTRFLDLQKAEAQAREAKIELGLERVRARAMAMHETDELLDAAELIYKELSALGIASMNISYAFVDEEEKYASYYGLNPVDGKMLPFPFVFPHTETEVMRSILSSWKKQEPFNVIELDEEATLNHQTYIGEHIQKLITKNNVDIPFSVEEFLAVSPKKAVLYSFNFTKGYLFNIGGVRLTKMQEEMVLRFTKVFEMTYRRFLDLKQAEEQAREAKIEVSLERVRSKAMAMHSPDDLSDTVNVFFKELKTLGIIPIRCGVGQIDEATRTTSLTTTTSSQQGDSFKVIGKIKQTGHPVLDGIIENWKLQKEYHPVLQGDDIKAYYNVMNAQIGYPDYPEGVTQYGNCFYFKEGFVFAWTESKLSEEELQIFRRFTSVLSLTYRRYLDLKEAEVRAFEAVREASLDRVRAEIASMRTAEDLNHITPIIWRELKTLEVPFIRCGVFIIDEEQANVQVYLSTPDGKSLGVLNLPIEFSALTSNSVEYWRKKKVYKEHWSKEQFIKWTKSMIEQRQVQNAQTYQGSSAPPESLNLHFVPFAQGMLYVGDISPLSEEKLQLVKSLAEGFSIAYARYEDFRNLENAKNRVESTLKELKSAQAQLIHSEKMASLGELTAGIAHEIKNPLNFVNNFSELSRELLDDLKAELEKDNKEEVMAIVKDVKQNLEKINQHGKRADSIVKGMLLHSRGSSGEKTLTDLNNLLDQYVTLAYHGLRAQDKEFNITIEKDYDESIEKINVVPQDISRVFLNIINNACYAANQKRLKEGKDFSPVLKVSTKNLEKTVEIRIRDNGNGIPKSIREKLFNPFFTTKAAGEGTGLGLSLSYDIVVKQHSGEIKFESEEGKYTEFIIILPKQ